MLLGRPLLIFLVTLFLSCNNNPEKRKFINYLDIKKSAEDSTDTLDLNYINSRHFRMTFYINDYEIVSKDPASTLQNVVGLPPSMRSGGSFQVILKGSHEVIQKGKHKVIQKSSHMVTLDSFKMNSPLFYRIEHGADKGLVKVKRGSFKIPIRGDSNFIKKVRKIIFYDNGKRKKEFDVSFPF